MSQVFQVFSKEIHETVVKADLYNKILFFFEHYPFHNILHQKINDILNFIFEKGDKAMITYLLDDSDLMKKILNISKESQLYYFETGQTMTRGYMAFIISISNKIVECQKKYDFVNNILEAIPEWKDYVDEDLRNKNSV